MSQSSAWKIPSERSKDPRYAILGAIGASVGGIVSAFVVTAIAGISLSIGGISLPTVQQFGVLFVAGAVGLGGTGIAYLSVRGLSVGSYVGSRIPSLKDLLWTAGGYLGALSLIFAAGVLLTVLQVEPDTTNRAAQAGMENPELLLWLVPISIFIIAPAEELLFRGVVQGRLREAFAAKYAIPFTAGLFASVHYFSLTGGSGARFIAIAILFLPSLVFGYVYERTRNLVVPILIHGFYNSTLIMLVYLSMRVLEENPMPA